MKKSLRRSEENPFLLDKDEELTICQYVLNSFSDDRADPINPLFAVSPEDDLEDRLARADNIIKYLVMTLIFSGGKIVPLSRIYEAAPEADRLYKAIKREAKRKGALISEMNAKEKERAIRDEYKKHKPDFKYLTEKHLNFSYHFQAGQEPRDFFGRIFDKYIGSHGLESSGAQGLYKIYNRMKKYLTI